MQREKRKRVNSSTLIRSMSNRGCKGENWSWNARIRFFKRIILLQNNI